MSLRANLSPFPPKNLPLAFGENLGSGVGSNFLISLDILVFYMADNQLNVSREQHFLTHLKTLIL